MYEISTRQNAAWGIEGYEPPKQYLDPKKIAEQRENKKTPAPRALKKGDYLTETLKAIKGFPGPNAYNIVKPWFPEDKKGKAPPGKVPHKNTFLDQLAKSKVPGPGAYNLLKSDKEIEEMNNKLKSQTKTSK
jgi:Sperm-tail PG-rich repeat